MSEKDDISIRRSKLSTAKQALLEKRLRGESIEPSRTGEISKRPAGEKAQLSFSQQRLWILNQWERASAAYNVSKAIRLIGQLNVAAMEQSLNHLIQRHETLRTTFVTVKEQPVQVIASALCLTLQQVDLLGLPEDKREVEVLRRATEAAQIPFDLAQGPLIRATLLRLGEVEHVLLFTMHHIVTDGWSMGVLYRELAVHYEACLTGSTAVLPELPLQYADFAHWQRGWMQGEALATQLSYWKHQLGMNPPVLELPIDCPRPSEQTFRGEIQSIVLSRSLSESLKALSQQVDVTLFMTLLAVFKVLLYRYTSQNDIIVRSPIANRNRVEIEGLIGIFVNTLVLRTNMEGSLRFRDVLNRVHEVCLVHRGRNALPVS